MGGLAGDLTCMHSTRCVAQSREQAKESHGNERKWETPTPERIREFHLNVWMRLHEGWHLDGIQDAKAASARFDQVARLVPCKPAPGGHAADPRDPQSPTNTQCPSALRFVQPYLYAPLAETCILPLHGVALLSFAEGRFGEENCDHLKCEGRPLIRLSRRKKGRRRPGSSTVSGVMT